MNCKHDPPIVMK